MMITFKIVRVPWKDHQSFSFETKLSDEVFRYGEIFKYSYEDVKKILQKVIPEFDTPGHTLSWKGLMKGSVHIFGTFSFCIYKNILTKNRL